MDSVDSDSELDIIEQAERQLTDKEVENIADHDILDEGEPVEVQADVENEDEQKNIKPKRAVRNPLPKLNADTLRGAKGLSVLPELFAKQQFKGSGHEEADLNVLLKGYEYWCHRLFPKYQFDQCIDKIEALGHKKVVMTYVKRIRMDILDDEPQLNQPSNDGDEINAPLADEQQAHIASVERTYEQTMPVKNHPHLNQIFESNLTEEQKLIVEANMQQALNIRRAKLKSIQEQAQAKLERRMPNTSLSNSDQTEDHPDLNQQTNTADFDVLLTK